MKPYKILKYLTADLNFTHSSNRNLINSHELVTYIPMQRLNIIFKYIEYVEMRIFSQEIILLGSVHRQPMNLCDFLLLSILRKK